MDIYLHGKLNHNISYLQNKTLITVIPVITHT